MPISIESRVNEKLYHARLLLDLTAIDAAQKPVDPTRYIALQGAAAATLHAALGDFIEEVAASCQVALTVYTLQGLVEALEAEGRSHAVVSTLLVLEGNSESWLSLIADAHAQFLQGTLNRTAFKQQKSDRIALVTVDDSIDLASCLDDFKDFVLTHRAYLSEW